MSWWKNPLFISVTAVLACGEPAGAVPPPPDQSAANCLAPTYASDFLVCADPELLALDRTMVALLSASRSAPPTTALHWFEPQEVWFRRRSLCAFSRRHAACLRAAYSERIDLLTGLAGIGSGQRQRPLTFAICPGAPWGNGVVRLHLADRDALTIKDGLGRVLLVASAIPSRDDWTPFVRYSWDASGIRVESSGGSVLRCQVSCPGRSSCQ